MGNTSLVHRWLQFTGNTSLVHRWLFILFQFCEFVFDCGNGFLDLYELFQRSTTKCRVVIRLLHHGYEDMLPA